MAKRMLIDATQPEEIRVAVVSGNRLEELDFETAAKKQLKGNIYLGKIIRVEPSLQAAFVDYGGNRHGFLAFGEIHPDYYRIPIADREALIAEEEAFERAEERVDDLAGDDDEAGDGADEAGEEAGEESAPDDGAAATVETLSEEGGGEGSRRRRRRSLTRRYKIQEVIKRGQVVLVQVAKEERGTKGAALTTRLSLAGRYCVLMPNTGRGGGISRKIANPADRKRLRAIVEDFDIPSGISVIVRTAGAKRTKAEIRRDYEYLLRLWSDIRERTLESTAPSLIHEEANLIKRSIRDLYTRDMDEILVDGEEGYRTAKDFMRTLVPSHAKRVQPYRDGTIPLFHRYQIENQIDAIHSPVVRLKSGGYMVLNQTEALVAIDVNSGRATRQRNIEETALQTNLEAAEEVARQLRLRDLAGLIVIDFIDMEVPKNQRAVEKRLKDAMKTDRARIQLGRISAFGLLEMSRQRLRSSLHEISTEHCPHCGGTGVVRSTESTALHVLRAIEEEGIRRRSGAVTVFVPTDVALYILNQKRRSLQAIEARYGFAVTVNRDDSLIPPDFRLEATKTAEAAAVIAPAMEPVAADAAPAEEEETGRRRQPARRRRARRAEAEPAAEAVAEDREAADERPATEEREAAGDEQAAPARKKRRRGKRGGRRRSRKGTKPAETATATVSVAAETEPAAAETEPAPAAEAAAQAPAVPLPAAGEAAEAAPKAPARRRRKRAAPAQVGEAAPAAGDILLAEEAPTEQAPAEEAAKPARARAGRKRTGAAPAKKAAPKAARKAARGAKAEEAEPPAAAPAHLPVPTDGEHLPVPAGGEAPPLAAAGDKADKNRRRGWWQRLTE